MKAKDIISIFKKYEVKYKKETYKYVADVLEEAKAIHKIDFAKNPSPKNDFEQSWKGIKGRALENIILYIVEDEIKTMGYKVVAGKKFENTLSENLSNELQQVKRNVSIDFNRMGFHVPDIDLVVYNPKTFKIIAILSSKASLRERIAQTAYWNLKIKNYALTKHIKVFFLSPDNDGEFNIKKTNGKSRAIAELDIDGTYILTKDEIKKSNKVETFDKFLSDLKKLLK